MKNYKKTILTIAALTCFLSVQGCHPSTEHPPKTESASSAESIPAASSASESDTEKEDSEEAFLVFPNPDMVSQELLRDSEDYAVLVESYLKDSSFKPMESSQTDALARLLNGHYEVAGRTDGKGREYYLALRRTDAPVYDDFSSLSVGYTGGSTGSEQVCQIEYYNEAIDPVLLYQIPNLSINIFQNGSTAQALDMFCFFPYDSARDTAFLYALDDNGRLQLDFLNQHPGLSFYRGNNDSCISFLYQDQDTVKFCSEPYSCYIALSQKDTDTLKQLLQKPQTGPEIKTGFESHGQILDYMRTVDSSIRTTGARFSIEGSTYELLGSKNSAGYIISQDESSTGESQFRLEYNPPVFSLIIDKIEEAMGVDYGSFSDTWFDIPLISASLDFPNLTASEDGTLTFCVQSQTVLDPEKLARLSQLLKQAVDGHESLSACPYVGILNLTREDGETLQMFVANDSCDSITYEGRIGFEYGKQEYLAEIFDNAMSGNRNRE